MQIACLTNCMLDQLHASPIYMLDNAGAVPWVRLSGPTNLFINVTNVDLNAYPPVAETYISAAQTLIIRQQAQMSLLFQKLNIQTSIKYSQVEECACLTMSSHFQPQLPQSCHSIPAHAPLYVLQGSSQVTLTVELLDLAGNLVPTLSNEVTSDQVRGTWGDYSSRCADQAPKSQVQEKKRKKERKKGRKGTS